MWNSNSNEVNFTFYDAQCSVNPNMVEMLGIIELLFMLEVNNLTWLFIFSVGYFPNPIGAADHSEILSDSSITDFKDPITTSRGTTYQNIIPDSNCLTNANSARYQICVKEGKNKN